MEWRCLNQLLVCYAHYIWRCICVPQVTTTVKIFYNLYCAKIMANFQNTKIENWLEFRHNGFTEHNIIAQ